MGDILKKGLYHVTKSVGKLARETGGYEMGVTAEYLSFLAKSVFCVKKRVSRRESILSFYLSSSSSNFLVHSLHSFLRILGIIYDEDSLYFIIKGICAHVWRSCWHVQKQLVCMLERAI